MLSGQGARTGTNPMHNFDNLTEDQIQHLIDVTVRTSAALTSADREESIEYVLQLKAELSRRQVSHLRKAG